MTYYECYADESLLKFLGLSSGELTGGHSFGRSFVSRKLQKASDSIGFVDEDPHAPRDSYLNHLFSLLPIYSDDYMFCAKDSKTNNRLIVIRPDLETFAIKLAKQKHINLNDKKYGLSMNKSILHQMLMPRKNVQKREKLISFFNDIDDHQVVITLRKLIKY